jgi:hypothetical protein
VHCPAERKRSKPADDARRMVVDVGDGLRLTVEGLGADSRRDHQRRRARADRRHRGQGRWLRLPLADRTELLGSTTTELTNEQKG